MPVVHPADSQPIEVSDCLTETHPHREVILFNDFFLLESQTVPSILRLLLGPGRLTLGPNTIPLDCLQGAPELNESVVAVFGAREHHELHEETLSLRDRLLEVVVWLMLVNK